MVAGRLFLFVMVVDVGQQCEDKSCKEEQQLPSYEHWHHLPLFVGRQTKEICIPNEGKQPPPFWCSSGAYAHTYYTTSDSKSQHRDALAASESCMERDVCKPRFLEARGWTVLRVWSRDWWVSPQKVIKAITAEAEKNRKKNA